MDFQSVSPLNVRLNKLSGNLLPMTGDDPLFPTAWRIYSAVVWLLEVVELSAIIPALMYVSTEKILQDVSVGVVVSAESFFLFARLHTHRNLVSQLIRKLNDILSMQDRAMESIVRSTIEPMQTPLKFYWVAGSLSIGVWCCMSFLTILEKSSFFYEDYRIPVTFSKQPFSTGVFLAGNLVVTISSLYEFTRKAALDVYMINLVMLVTAQYRYVSTKLVTIFQEESLRNEKTPRVGCTNVDSWVETELKALCKHHNAIMHMIPILKKVLSVNFSLIYFNNVLRFCFTGVMLAITVTTAPLEALMVFMYICGGLVQLYIICLSVQQLLDASVEVTNKAFHENWYQSGPFQRHTFLMIIAANNLQCKLAAYNKFNLSLPSFMTILNQSYSIALLFLRVR